MSSRRRRRKRQRPAQQPTTPWHYKRNSRTRVRVAEVKLAPMPRDPSGGDWSTEIAFATAALRRVHAERGL